MNYLKRLFSCIAVLGLSLSTYAATSGSQCGNQKTRTCEKCDETTGDTINKKVKEGEDCPDGWKQSSPSSLIDNLSFNHIHWGTDYSVNNNTSGCSPCGSFSSGKTVSQLSFVRYHRFRNSTEHSSFGPGIFSNWDLSLTLTSDVVDYFFPQNRFAYRLTPSSKTYYDKTYSSIKQLELYTDQDTVTKDHTLASYAILTTLGVIELRFDIFEVDSQVSAGRLVSITDYKGYKKSLTYVHAANATVTDPSVKYQIATINDDNNRQIQVSYNSQKKNDSWVISSITLPNNEVVTYNYGSGTTGRLESVDHPDSTQSTFTTSITGSGQTKIDYFEASAHGMDRHKSAYLTNNITFTTTPGGIELSNSSSLMVQKVTKGTTEELVYEAIFSADGQQHFFREGGDKLKINDRNQERYFTSWQEDVTAGVTGTKETTHGHGTNSSTFMRNQGTFAVRYDQRDNRVSILYNSENNPTYKFYEDGSNEHFKYNQFQSVTYYQDRLGRVTLKEYDAQNNLTKTETGIELVNYTGNPTDQLAGLTYEVFLQTTSSLSSFSFTNPDFYGISSLMDLSPATDMTEYVIAEEGFIKIDQAGDYTFRTKSKDGSRLYINAQLVVDNDGTHGKKTVTSSLVNLAAGYHTVRMESFYKSYTGNPLCLVTYSGLDTGNEFSAFAANKLSHNPSASDQVLNYTSDHAVYTKSYYPSTHANKYLLQTETDANGNTVEYIYNSDNQLTQIIEPDDSGTGTHTRSSFTYDYAKRLSSSTDAVGRTTTFEYDERDRIIKKIYNDGSTELIFYGSGTNANLVVKTKDRNGNTTSFTYDSLGRATQTIRAYSVMNANGTSETVNSTDLQSLEVCTYLEGMNLKTSCTINGDRTEYEYDYRNRRIKTIRFADANSTLISETEYLDNKVFKTTDPYGRSSYRLYRGSDSALIRTVQETIAGSLNYSDYDDVALEARDLTVNAAYLITDYELDDEGQTTATIDPKGIRHESEYDSRGRATKQIRAVGSLDQTSQTIYDLNSNVIEIRHPRYFSELINDRTTMTYGQRNLLKTRTVAAGSSVQATESFTYHDDGRAASHTDFRGNTSSTEWHVCCGRFQAGIDQAGHANISSTDFYGNVTHTAVLKDYVTADMGGTTTQSEHNYTDGKTFQEVTTRYDSRHRPIARTVWLDKLANVQANDVPIAGDVGVTETGLTTTMIYFDETTGHAQLSPLLTELSADGITFDTNNDGAAVITINPESEVSVAIQDGVGRTIASGMYDKDDYALGTYTLVTWSTVTHDTVTNDLLETKSTSALGFENKVQTDGAGRRIKTIDAELEEATFEYDANSNLVKSRDANGVGQDCTFDDLNRDVSCTDTDGDTTSRIYNLNNAVVKSVDAKGEFSLVSYDERNRRTNSWDRLVTDGYSETSLPPSGDSTRFNYDDNSNVTKITDVQESDTDYTFDVRNLNTQVTYEDAGVTSCSYDALRRKDVCTDQLGDTVTYNYDLASRMTAREYHTSGSTLESTDSFTYDGTSRVLTAHKGRYNNTCTYTYDEIGRKKTEKTSVAGGDYTIIHTYDADNRLTNCAYPAGNNVAKSYTHRNQLETVAFNAANIITSTFDDGMRESTRTFGNGLANTMTYNLDNTRDEISVAGKVDLSFTYTYDANKNVLSESSLGTAMTGYGWSASFDEIDRVTQWDRDNATDSQTWTLDKIGNWDNTTGSLAGSSFNENRTHNGVHELTVIGGNTVTYDDKGNMTTDANGNTLVWDIDNHLESFGTVDFTYDALGRRLEKIDGTNSTLYICDGQRVIEEYEDSGSGFALARSYVHGSFIDDLVGKVEDNSGSPEILFYHSGRQYNVRGLTDSSGDIVELYAYSTYGKQTVLDEMGNVLAGSSYDNNYGFTGRYLDEETGLWYFRARYFSDEMGRFISRDPLGYVDGMSLYAGYFAMHFGVDPYGQEFADAGIDLISTNDFNDWLKENNKKRGGAGAGTNTWQKPTYIGFEDVEEYETCYCKCAKAHTYVFLVGISFVDLGVIPRITQQGLNDVIEHENKRRKTMELGFGAYLKPLDDKEFEFCVLKDSPRNPKRELSFFLQIAKNQSELDYFGYLTEANKIIGRENKRENAKWKTVDGVRYFDGFKKKEEVLQPTPNALEPPKSTCL